MIDAPMSICRIETIDSFHPVCEPFFLSRTDDEISLVCPTENVPSGVLERDDGWRMFRFSGQLDLSLIGILSRLSALLAENGIGIFVISTFGTDYILVKEENMGKAEQILSSNGYEFEG